MAKLTQSYTDNRGTIHGTPEQAVLADIAAALGRINADAGIVGGIASLILDKRDEIEAAFRDLDDLRGAA